jgi:hypothetical protein
MVIGSIGSICKQRRRASQLQEVAVTCFTGKF